MTLHALDNKRALAAKEIVMTRRCFPPRIRPDAEPVLRERFLTFLDRMKVSVKLDGYVALAGMPRLKISALTTEALDRLVCWQIEKFWADKTRRFANREAYRSIAAE